MEVICTESKSRKCLFDCRNGMGQTKDKYDVLEKSNMVRDGENRTNEECKEDALLQKSWKPNKQYVMGCAVCQTGRRSSGDDPNAARATKYCGSQEGGTQRNGSNDGHNNDDDVSTTEEYHFESTRPPSRRSSGFQRTRMEYTNHSPMATRKGFSTISVEAPSINDDDNDDNGAIGRRSSSSSNSWWDEFFHSNTGMEGCRIAGKLRVAYATLLFTNLWYTSLDLDFFFLPSHHGVLDLETVGRKTLNSDYLWTIMTALPNTDTSWYVVWGLAMVQALLLGLGIGYPRLQACCVYFWLCQIHFTNGALWNGEDTVFRILGFLLIFFPLHYYNIKEEVWDKMGSDAKGRGEERNGNDRKGEYDGSDDKHCESSCFQNHHSWPMWPFRLMQIEMCIIYISTGVLKMSGKDWENGTVM